MTGELTGLGDFLFAEGDPPLHVLLVIAALTQALGLCLDRGRDQQDADRIGVAGKHLAGALDVYLEDDVPARRRVRYRRPVEVVEHGRPLEEPASGDMFHEGVLVDEVIGVVRLARPLWPSRPGPAQPELVVARQQSGYDRSLADPAGTDEYEYQLISGRSGALGGLKQRLTLLGTEALQTAGLRDADLLHEAASLDLAGAWERL